MKNNKILAINEIQDTIQLLSGIRDASYKLTLNYDEKSYSFNKGCCCAFDLSIERLQAIISHLNENGEV